MKYEYREFLQHVGQLLLAATVVRIDNQSLMALLRLAIGLPGWQCEFAKCS